MSDVWKIAITLSGLGAVASFILWSLYKQWLSLPIFQTLTRHQQYRLFILFLLLTFFFAISALASYTYIQAREIRPQPAEPRVDSELRTEDALVELRPPFDQGYVHSMLGKPQMVDDSCEGFHYESYRFEKAFALLAYDPQNKLTAVSVLMRDASWNPHLDWLDGCLSCLTFADSRDFEPHFYNNSTKELFYSEARSFTPGTESIYYLYNNHFGAEVGLSIPFPDGEEDIYTLLDDLNSMPSPEGRFYPTWFQQARRTSRPNGFAEVRATTEAAQRCGSQIYMDYYWIIHFG
jgi:hypothetical protein